MHTVRWDWPWLRYLCMTVAYGAGYGFLHVFWISHWQLTAGFRLAFLLLVPRRYWPALFVGEAAALGKMAYDCSAQLGTLWSLTVPFIFMATTMPVVWLFLKYRPVLDVNKRVVISSLLLCFLAVALVSTGANAFEYTLMQGLRPAKQLTAANLGYFSYLWFLGASLGIYMIVPLVLWAYSEDQLHIRELRRRMLRSPVLLEAATLLLPCLYLFAYTIEYSHVEWIRHVSQAAILLTPLWFTVRYGWQGASLACLLANLAVVHSMPTLYDTTTLQTQTMMMVSSTAWFLLGARLSAIRQCDPASH